MTFYKFPFISEQWFRGDDLDSFLKRFFGTKTADRLRTETARTEYSMYGPIDVVHIFKLSPGGQYRDPSLSPQIEKFFNAGKCVFDSPDSLVALQRWLFHNRKRI